MGKNRTLAFQVSEELFQRVKEYLERYEQVYGRRLTQREFIIRLIEQALEEAEEEFEAARAAGQEEQAANSWESGEPDEDTPDDEEPENWDGGKPTRTPKMNKKSRRKLHTYEIPIELIISISSMGIFYLQKSERGDVR